MAGNTTFFTRTRSRKRNPLQMFRDMSLRIKLILLFLAVSVLASGGVAYVALHNTTTALTEQVGENLTAVAEMRAQNIGTILAQHVTSMQAWNQYPDARTGIAAQNAAYTGDRAAIQEELLKLEDQWGTAGDDDPLIQDRLGNELAQELQSYTRSVPDFTAALLTDRYGGLVAASDHASNYYLADKIWWQAAYNDGQGAVYIGEPERNENTKAISIDLAVPVYASNGTDVIGILRTTLDATTLLGGFHQAEIGETGKLDLVFPSGKAFTVGDDEVKHDVNPEVIAQLDAASHDHIETVYDGVPSVVGQGEVASPEGEKFIANLGWRVLARQQQDEALASIYQTRDTTIMLAVIIAVVANTVAIVVGRAVATPIVNLTRAVTQFATGDRTARAESNSSDEIGSLASNFNLMAEQVSNLLVDIQARSAEMEERTRELEASQRVTLAASERVTPDDLLDLVVNLIRDQFELYHAQVYIVDAEQQAAVLRQSTGYAGRQLLQRKHKIPLDATSLVTKSIHTGEPVLVDDTGTDPDFLPNPLLPDTNSELVVPLKLKGQVIGALDAQDRTPGRFGPSTVALFQSMTEQIAILFENSELMERITEQTEALTIFANQLRTAAEIARRLGTILDPEQVLEQAVEMLQSRFGLYHAHVYVLDDAGRRLVMRAGSGEVGRVLRKRGHAIDLDAEKSLVARAARNEAMVLVNDTSLDSDFLPNPLLPQTRSEVSIPLVAGDKVLGVLDIQDDQPNRFSETDVDTFGTLAGQVATALQTAGIFEQTQARLKVSRALASAQTEEEVLDAMVAVADFHPRVHVSIYTFDRNTDEHTSIARRVDAFDSGIANTLPVGMPFLASRSTLTRHMSADRPFVSSRIHADERIDPTTREMANATGITSIAILPITAGGEWLGNIAVSSREEGGFNEHKLRPYQALAEQGAMALRVALLSDEVQRSLTELDQMFSAAPDGVRVIDTDFNVLRANEPLATLAGLNEDEVAGKKCYEVFGGETCHTPGCTMARILDGEKRVEIEVDKERSDGARIPCLVSAAPLTRPDGEVTGIVEILKDITGRKQAEVEHERFTNQLRTAADLAEQINAILDPDELLNEVVNQLYNRFDLYHVHVYLLDQPLLEELKQLDVNEVASVMNQRNLVMRAGSGEVGQTLLKQRHAIPLSREKSLVARAARDQAPVLVNDTTQEPTFMPNPLLPQTRSEVAVPLITSKGTLGVLDVQDNHPGRFTQPDLDVLTTLAGQIATALQNASYFEEIQRTARKLREVDRLKSEFLASMSHELRTPLNSIIGYTEIMLMGLDSDLDPELLEDIQAIYDNGQHLLRIINDVLDLAKIEAGRLELNIEEVSVELLVASATSSTVGLLINKPVELNVEVEEDVPSIWGDQVRLNQILNNLTSNAVKFTEEGHITLRAFKDDGWVCLEVEDTGVGISEEDQDKLFERFQQVDGSNARRQEGTGLGLAITRHLVQMHGGVIGLQSTPGEGSTFTVRLPLRSPEDGVPVSIPAGPEEYEL